jgi:hypothetical protein
LHYAARLRLVSSQAARASSGLRKRFFAISHAAATGSASLSAFAAAKDVLAADPNLGTDAVYRAGGTGSEVTLRIVRASPDRISASSARTSVRAVKPAGADPAQVESPDRVKLARQAIRERFRGVGYG